MFLKEIYFWEYCGFVQVDKMSKTHACFFENPKNKMEIFIDHKNVADNFQAA